jgi:imidazolonepropionase-like amidohydrolase
MLKRFSLFAAVVISCCAFSFAQQIPPDPQLYVIHAGKLLDVVSGHLLTNQTLLIRKGKIEAIGENLAIPSGATVLDLSKMTVLPGLIDCRTHLADLYNAEPLTVI